MSDISDINQDASTEFQEALDGARKAVLKLQNLVEVPCPYPGCGKNVFPPAPDEDQQLTATNTEIHSSNAEKVDCREGHEVFIYYE